MGCVLSCTECLGVCGSSTFSTCWSTPPRALGLPQGLPDCLACSPRSLLLLDLGAPLPSSRSLGGPRPNTISPCADADRTMSPCSPQAQRVLVSIVTILVCGGSVAPQSLYHLTLDGRCGDLAIHSPLHTFLLRQTMSYSLQIKR